jgi:Ca-activated chloride channel family protein
LAGLATHPAAVEAADGLVDSHTALQQAHDAYQSGEYELAMSLYDQVASYAGWFGAGASAYKNGELDSAVLYFRQAAWQAKDDGQRAAALFNLGNSFYQANLLPQAIETYRQALLYQSDFPEAEHNLALAQQRDRLERQGKQQHEEQSGEGEGQGDSGRDAKGAFYGGQKPSDSQNTNDGIGGDGDGIDGERGGEQMVIPQASELTDYRLQAREERFRLGSEAGGSAAQAVLDRQRRQQRAEAFEHQMQQLEDDQKTLLKRLFEREEGFHAAQPHAHPIPGVQPW